MFYRAEAYGFPPEFIEMVRDVPVKPERGSMNGRTLLEGKVVHVPDVLADPDYTFVEAQRLGRYRTLLGVPMLREGMPIGVLTLTRLQVRPFTDKQIELVSTRSPTKPRSQSRTCGCSTRSRTRAVSSHWRARTSRSSFPA